MLCQDVFSFSSYIAITGYAFKILLTNFFYFRFKCIALQCHRTMTQRIKSKSCTCKQNSYMHIYLIHLDFITYVVYFDILLEFRLF